MTAPRFVVTIEEADEAHEEWVHHGPLGEPGVAAGTMVDVSALHGLKMITAGDSVYAAGMFDQWPGVTHETRDVVIPGWRWTVEDSSGTASKTMVGHAATHNEAEKAAIAHIADVLGTPTPESTLPESRVLLFDDTGAPLADVTSPAGEEPAAAVARFNADAEQERRDVVRSDRAEAEAAELEAQAALEAERSAAREAAAVEAQAAEATPDKG